MAFINCESMFSLLLYIVNKYIIKCGYHGYMQLYIKALFNIALKKFAKMFSNKRKTKDLVAVRNIKYVSKSNIPTTTHLALKQVGIFHFV